MCIRKTKVLVITFSESKLEVISITLPEVGSETNVKMMDKLKYL